MRLNKFIAAAGYCSRRQADFLIAEGKVEVNGQAAVLGLKVGPSDQVVVEGNLLEQPDEERLVYLAFNKPRGIVCTANPQVKDNIIDFIDYPVRIFTVGRLDKDSEGLILLTNDGAIFNKIVRAEYGQEKEYLVELNRPYSREFIRQMETGVKIIDRVTNPARLIPVSDNRFRLVIDQGLNRQIRRMCQALGYRVTFLQRIRIMNICLGQLPVGQYRPLTGEELQELQNMIGNH